MNYDCIGFYGDGTIMFATDESGEEYEVDANRPSSSLQGFTYNASDNCVVHVKSRGEECTPLPEHFRGEAVRAIGQVWASASATIVMVEHGV
jgi:hypothetical protein